jgi:hypothetical protein
LPFTNDFGGMGSSHRVNVPRNVMLCCCWPRSSIAVKVIAGSLFAGGGVLPR